MSAKMRVQGDGIGTTSVKEITAWLDGRGLTATPDDRRPWVDALDMLGGPRRAITLNGPPHIPTQRRRADHRPLPARETA